ncbi:SUF system Fe-S cluster assembly protein [Hyphomicrobium sp.]|uniref:SUF system Fe-S cluster assembly protein n=1 Tax=Hyphomicrobium sp. TaxID=82 RepID=UPI002D1FBEBD|nr:SUF system Fe-S cluster assembly protein [Hyphomicrobium sp.]
MTEQVETDKRLSESERPPAAKLAEAEQPVAEDTTTSDVQAAAPADAPSADGASSEAVSGLSQDELDQLTADIIAALKTVYDPEIPADIYELGLIYKIDINDNREIAVEMTLTAPGCPVAGEMPVWVENAVSAVPGVSGVTVTLTFDPPWEQSRMSDEARLALNMF